MVNERFGLMSVRLGRRGSTQDVGAIYVSARFVSEYKLKLTGGSMIPYGSRHTGEYKIAGAAGRKGADGAFIIAANLHPSPRGKRGSKRSNRDEVVYRLEVANIM